jgi:hypothetical protein
MVQAGSHTLEYSPGQAQRGGVTVDLKTIEITWMDGETAVYKDVTTSTLNGVLHVHEYAGDSHVLTNEWHFPISNIRVWNPITNGHRKT